MKVAIKEDISYEVFEGIIVTALEGGSNYWADVNSDYFKGIEEYHQHHHPLTVRIAKGLYYNKESEVQIFDREDPEEVLGVLTYQNVRDTFEDFPQGYVSQLSNLLREDYDAWDADTVFQVLVLGDVEYG